jgi:hypothetical protein
MAEESLPPQTRRIAMYSAGGGFGGALLAIVVAKILAGPCCCHSAHAEPEDRYRQPAAVSSVSDEARRVRRDKVG